MTSTYSWRIHDNLRNFADIVRIMVDEKEEKKFSAWNCLFTDILRVFCGCTYIDILRVDYVFFADIYIYILILCGYLTDKITGTKVQINFLARHRFYRRSTCTSAFSRLTWTTTFLRLDIGLIFDIVHIAGIFDFDFDLSIIRTRYLARRRIGSQLTDRQNILRIMDPADIVDN